MTDRGLTLAYSSVVLFATVVFSAWLFAPDAFRPLSLICAVAAVIIGRQAALHDPAALTWALLSSAPPVMALVAGRSTGWLIAPLAALLLVAGELNALSWELRGADDVRALARQRLIVIGKLGSAALVTSALVGLIALGPAAGGTVAVVLAAGGLAMVGWVVFGRDSLT